MGLCKIKNIFSVIICLIISQFAVFDERYVFMIGCLTSSYLPKFSLSILFVILYLHFTEQFIKFRNYNDD